MSDDRMSDDAIQACAMLAAAALVVIWSVGVGVAYVQGERRAERPPGTRRRIVGGALGLSFATLPLIVPLQRDEAALVLMGTVVVTQQLAAGLTFSGTLAAWRAVERREPPPVPPLPVVPNSGDGGGVAG